MSAGVTVMAVWLPVAEPSVTVTVRSPVVFRVTPLINDFTPKSVERKV